MNIRCGNQTIKLYVETDSHTLANLQSKLDILEEVLGYKFELEEYIKPVTKVTLNIYSSFKKDFRVRIITYI